MEPSGALVAIFLDFENLVMGAMRAFGRTHPLPLPIEPIVDFACTKGNVVMRRAYADWMHSECKKYVTVLVEHGFELVYLPQTSRQGKNGADVRLAVDMMEVLERQPQINSFLIGSGDTDFIPVIQKVRARCKGVCVVGFEACVGRLVKANTTEFVSLDELCAPAMVAAAREARKKTKMESTRSLRERLQGNTEGQASKAGLKSEEAEEEEEGDEEEEEGDEEEEEERETSEKIGKQAAEETTKSALQTPQRTSLFAGKRIPLLSPQHFVSSRSLPLEEGRNEAEVMSPSERFNPLPSRSEPTTSKSRARVRPSGSDEDRDILSGSGSIVRPWSEAVRLVSRFLFYYRQGSIRMSDFKRRLLRLDSSFSERRFGFDTFEHFVEALYPRFVRHIITQAAHADGVVDSIVVFSVPSPRTTRANPPIRANRALSASTGVMSKQAFIGIG